MNTKQKRNWWIDLVLFTGFIITFFLDITGVNTHQWIGIFCGGLATYHLFLHLNWVDAVSKRFFRNTSGKARLYYVSDMLLLLEFCLIGVTGLVISTWLNLPLSNFNSWLNIHIAISIATLVTLLLKLVFHWRWIVRTARKILTEPVMTPIRNATVQPANTSSTNGMGRNEFLQVMGVLGAASVLALVNASKGLTESVSRIESTVNEEVDTRTSSNAVITSNQSCKD